MTGRLKSDSWADSPLKIQPQISAVVKKLLLPSKYLSDLEHKQGEVSCAHPARSPLLRALHPKPDLALRSSTHLWLKMMMLPKARSPIVWDPAFLRNELSVPGLASHSFCLRLEEQFQNETKNLMNREKIVQQQTLLLHTILLLVASESARFIVSCLFPFFFWFLAKSHCQSGMSAVV